MIVNQKNFPFVSVIIPVFNDTKRLGYCLQALESQTYSKNLYEVIVINNNSTENIQTVVDRFPQVRMANEKKQGSYAARNKGISLSLGKILAFTDSDCIPADDWIEKGVAALQKNPDCAMVAGEIELFYQNPHNPTIVELYDSMNFLRQKIFVEELKFGATANLFTFKDCFEKVGLFNTDLRSSGDREWGQRLFNSGLKQVYANDARVAHPARNEVKEIKKKTARIVEGLYTLENQQKKSLPSFIREVFWDIKPPRKEIIEILKTIDLHSLNQKIEYIVLFLKLRWIGAGKKIELYFKG